MAFNLLIYSSAKQYLLKRFYKTVTIPNVFDKEFEIKARVIYSDATARVPTGIPRKCSTILPVNGVPFNKVT